MQSAICPLTGGLRTWQPLADSEGGDQRRQDENCVDVCGPFVPSHLPDVDARVQSALSIGGTCKTVERLRALFEKKAHPTCYDGFEPSGRMHIAQGIIKADNVNKLTRAGCVFIFWVADWFAMLNNKMGGDLYKIRRLGQYFIEIWKSCGMDMRNVRFLWASEEINRRPSGYWSRVMDIAKGFTLSRVKRCSTIMGREEGDEQPAAQILYPLMQCSDVFFLKADIAQLGMDQITVNMLAVDYAKDPEQKPVIIAHEMLPGLGEGELKMSKSSPDSAIFMEDSDADVKRKIKRAFCPPQVTQDNPCVAYVSRILFPRFGEFRVDRSEANGGPVAFKTDEAFRAAYLDGSLHPGDLKNALTVGLNKILAPTRDHFAKDPEAMKLLSEIRQWQVTR